MLLAQDVAFQGPTHRGWRGWMVKRHLFAWHPPTTASGLQGAGRSAHHNASARPHPACAAVAGECPPCLCLHTEVSQAAAATSEQPLVGSGSIAVVLSSAGAGQQRERCRCVPAACSAGQQRWHGYSDGLPAPGSTLPLLGTLRARVFCHDWCGPRLARLDRGHDLPAVAGARSVSASTDTFPAGW